ncbi:MAG: hypothetical protein AB1566_09205 [Chloroflexota bacterium]
MITYWSMRALMFLTQTVPVRLSYFVAMRLGDLFFFLWRKKREITVENMRHVLGHDADHRQVVETARRSIRNYAKVIVEFLRLPRLSDQEVISLVRQSFGWEHLDRALAHGKGVILVLSHFGNWDLAGAVLAARTYPTNAVADSFRPERLNQLVQGPRIKRGIRIMHADGNGVVRQLYQALKQNQVVGLAIDLPTNGEGVPVRFFDGTVSLPAAPAALSLKTGAKVLVGYLARLADDHFAGGFGAPIEYEATGDRQRDVAALTQEIVSALEEIIRKHPDQWYMFRPLWSAAAQA